MALSGPEAPYPHGRQQLVEALRLASQPTPVVPLQLTFDMAITEQSLAVSATRRIQR